MKVFTGRVISKSMQKTANVAVERIVVHPFYKKRIKRTKKYHVHDELGVEVGNKVRFVDARAYSKTKKWKIIEVIISGKEPRGKTKAMNQQAVMKMDSGKKSKTKGRRLPSKELRTRSRKTRGK